MRSEDGAEIADGFAISEPVAIPIPIKPLRVVLLLVSHDFMNTSFAGTGELLYS